VSSPRAPILADYTYLFFFLSVTDQGSGIWGEHRWYSRVLPVHRNNMAESCRRSHLNSWPSSSEASALSLGHTASAKYLYCQNINKIIKTFNDVHVYQTNTWDQPHQSNVSTCKTPHCSTMCAKRRHISTLIIKYCIEFFEIFILPKKNSMQYLIIKTKICLRLAHIAKQCRNLHINTPNQLNQSQVPVR